MNNMFEQIRDLFTKYNNLQDESKIKLKSLVANIIFSKDSFTKEYSETERTYQFTSDNKMFHSWMIGDSLFGNCLDGTDIGVRLDYYMFDSWKVEKCYLVE